MKKLIALILALCMVFSLSICAYAEEEITEEETAAEQDAPELKMDSLTAGTTRSIWIRDNGSIATVGGTGGKTNEWRNIVQIASYNYAVGLKDDGTVVVEEGVQSAYNIRNWTNIVDIDTNENNTIGLTDKGSVVVAGYNTYNQCNTSSWTDIIDVAMGYRTAYGLTSDGTVRAAGHNGARQCDV